jgi:hypothetical protein
MSRAPNGYRKSVFINAPFSADRQDVFHAIVFTVQACGFAPRCAREFDDAGQVRFDKIADLIRDCRLGIHDISFMELDDGLPRFNMPFELGLFLGAARFSEGWSRKKSCTIFDREPFRYQRALSDIAGQDIRAHGCAPREASAQTRDWLSHQTERQARVPGAAAIWTWYEAFRLELPAIAAAALQDDGNLTFNERRYFAAEWLQARLT